MCIHEEQKHHNISIISPMALQRIGLSNFKIQAKSKPITQSTTHSGFNEVKKF